MWFPVHCICARSVVGWWVGGLRVGVGVGVGGHIVKHSVKIYLSYDIVKTDIMCLFFFWKIIFTSLKECLNDGYIGSLGDLFCSLTSVKRRTVDHIHLQT